MLTVIWGGGGGGARNRGMKHHMTHEVAHMLGGLGACSPRKFIFYPVKSVFLQYEQQFTQLNIMLFKSYTLKGGGGGANCPLGPPPPPLKETLMFTTNTI